MLGINSIKLGYSPKLASHHRSCRKQDFIITRKGMRTVIAASAGAPSFHDIKLIGMGGCNIDYLASVGEFPKPDDKLRTEKLEVQGGGNSANALTAAARLGLSPYLVTKLGADSLGDSAVSELSRDGVNTKHVLRAPNAPSPFTYIIVDRTGGTRTCIHTPGASFTPDEMSPQLVSDILQDAALVYFDGRLAEAALLLARGARAAGVPVLVEAERLRPGLDELLAEADFVVTSANFPQDWTGEAALCDALITTALRLPHTQFIATTLGKRGAVLVERSREAAPHGGAAAPLGDVVAQLEQQASQGRGAPGQEELGCVSKSGVRIALGSVAALPGPTTILYSPGRDPQLAEAKASGAATRAAALNADAANAQGYQSKSQGASSMADAEHGLTAQVTVATSAVLPQEHVVDTTGAGDAFIGSVLYGLSMGLSRPRMLQLAATVAACKCTAIGARQGLPTREQLAQHLLAVD